MSQITLTSEITCPDCQEATEAIMPTDACQFFWECPNCGNVAKPKTGDCCVYCSYGTNPCPPVQQNGSSCC